MTLWLDAHFGPALALWMGALTRVGCKTLREVGLDHCTDVEIFQAARRFPNIVVFTKDYDYVQLVELQGPPPQVIWMRCPNMSNLKLQKVLSSTLPDAIKLISGKAPLVEITV